jgi:hypothetical protein
MDKLLLTLMTKPVNRASASPSSQPSPVKGEGVCIPSTEHSGSDQGCLKGEGKSPLPWRERVRVRGRRLARSSAGVTLVEAVVAVGILTMAVALIGTSIFQSLSIQRYWRDDVIATKEWRHAGSRFVTDLFNAETIDLVDGAAPVSAVTFTWVDGGGNPHTATYSLVGDTLIRDVDGFQITVARGVLSAGFSRNARLVTFDLEVQADLGKTESMSLQTYLRMLNS